MIDVVVPVYRGAAQTRRCLESVLASTPGAHIVVVDDASPEEELRDYLRGLAREGRIELLANESNAGFVRSVNRGMALHADRDVVLLNSDTEVANDWLERLRQAAHRHDDIATATPFSNNATICSYPFLGWTGGVPGALGLAGLDLLFARTNSGMAIEIPTAVGFCMYIRREALQALGAFDAERFGRGYGEENDFCMRAAKAGRRNVLACDVFVYHEGGVSFSAEREALLEGAAAALLEAHPDYGERVEAFIANDPAQPARAAIDIARIACGAEEARHVQLERRDELAGWMARMRELQRYVEGRERHIDELREGLEKATTLVREREEKAQALDEALSTLQKELKREIDRLNDENRRLREGLAHAESLAFSREKELQRLRSSWAGRLHELLRRSPGG